MQPCDWKYLVVLREDDLPQLHRSFAAVITQLPQQCKQVRLEEVNSQKRAERVVQAYRWAKGLRYSNRQKQVHSLNLIECQDIRTDTQGRVTNMHDIWITKFSLTARKVFYLLLQLAHLIFQLMQAHRKRVAGSLLRQGFPDGLRTAKNLAFRLLEAWRNLSLLEEPGS
jgi:hypothetical protein